MSRSFRLIYGVGVNDAAYRVSATENIGGRTKNIWICPVYRVWTGMLERCYSAKFQARNTTYRGCAVENEWMRFSVFRAWMIQQDYEGKHLDKDILFPGNKMYSPDRCAFVCPDINRFVVDSGAIRGDWPIGVTWNVARKMFAAQCRNPFTKQHKFLGYFDSAELAHEAWRAHKYQIALTYAESQADPRVAAALRARYAGPAEIFA